jgi:hypothetical protein
MADAVELFAARRLRPMGWSVFDAQKVTSTIVNVDAQFIDMVYSGTSHTRFECSVYSELGATLLSKLWL